MAAAAFAQQSNPPAQEPLPDAPQATAAASIVPNGPTVVMDTSAGRITCQFFQKQAPKTVANFIALAQGTRDWTDPATKRVMHHKPLYDGTVFHRVIPEFMIQGGDPEGTGMGDPGYSFADEFDPNLGFDVPGRLAMANSGPNTNGSQFFITEVPTPHLNQIHTIFGQCDEPSVNVVKTIARVQANSDGKPLVPVVLRKVTIVPEGQPLPPAPGAPGQAAATPTVPRKMIALSREVTERMVTYHPNPVKPGEVRQDVDVVLDALIDEKGAVESLHAISAPAILYQPPIDAVKTWRYKPFLLNGEAIAVKTSISVSFKE